MEKWNGKVAIVTGASSGIGDETCRQLVEKGMIVVGFDISDDKLQMLEKDLKGKLGKFYYLKVDLCSEENILEAFHWVKQTLKSVDVLVNNAGVWKYSDLLGNTNDWKQMYDINIIGANICSREAIKIMEEIQIKEGHIININGVAGHYIFPFLKDVSVYSATKHSVTTITEYLRELMGMKNLPIRVTSISPGAVETKMTEELSKLEGVKMLKSIDVAEAIMYALSAPQHVNVCLAAGYMFLFENPGMSLGMELIQYMIVGILFTLIFLVFLIKKEAIASNYNFIQTIFIHWSNKRSLHPNVAYKKNIKTVKSLIIPLAILSLSIAFGPLVSTINDIGKLPLDYRTHFVLFWPTIVDTNKISMYGIIYAMQVIFTIILYISTLSFNLGFMVFLNEVTNQFEMLLDEIKDAFKYKRDKQFQPLFIDCIRHHQIIIKFLDDLKSYFKWIILIEIIAVQVVLAILIYNLTKINASLGYKMKVAGSLLFNLLPICFHCHIGEVILSLHTRLSNHIYNMIWYDMPNENKQLIVIMFQRTQRNLTLSSALFSNERASRSLISKVIKQVYTILNVLLKT